ELFTPEQVQQSGGLTVRTTLDFNDQKLAERAVANQLERLHSQETPANSHNINDAALVALDPRTGEILALVGSPDYNDVLHAGAINMALAPRQPGSALKPFIYAAAFDPSRPQPWTPASMLLDVQTNFVTHDNQPYTPVNYDGLEHGPVLVREALASSLNVPAVLALQHIGLPALFSEAGRLGITTLGDPDQSDLSLALGGGEVRLLDLAAAYGAFANGGYRVTPHAILEISDTHGEVVYTAPLIQPRRVLDGRVAWLISDILSDDNARMIGFQLNSVLRLDRPAAVKTGTTTNFHDNWAVGYTPDLVVGVWAGNATHDAMRNITGLTGAAPIWAQALRSMLAGAPVQDFTRPAGLTQVEVCALSGLLPTPACPYRKLEWFIDGTQPTQPDSIYTPVELDSATNRLADSTTPPARRIPAVALDLPPQAGPWARAHGLLLLSDLRQAAGSNLPADNTPTPIPGEAASPTPVAVEDAPLSLLSPADRSTYTISALLPLNGQQLHLEAVAEAGLHQVTLFVDGQPLAVLASPPYEAWWVLSPGEHAAWATALHPDGTQVESERVRFTVK
ncbi:MAG: penicillin-binding protein, partial [Chloroflexi bacterium]|nr:penicillin-binding protein [Chloroflexota bacterium]